ncbi:hypothetical protein F4859DRAFT_520352 [Xylaria cf. heliscus]|nr:hypothetical protein F4859DRAFT_520352 [Xylaria cf. heliscus]
MGNAGQGISSGGFLAVVWTFTAVTTVLFIGRLTIRGTLLKSFYLDDAFSAAAWLFMTIAIIVATVATPLTYEFSSILVGETPKPSPAELARITITLRKHNIPAEFLFWTALYCAKLSFMFLYRLVFGSRRENRCSWAIATTYIIISYGVCLIGVFGQCGDVSNLFSYEGCMTTYVAQLRLRLIWVQYFFNVTSDFFVLILPLPIIWRLSMPINQKIAVTGICSLAVVTVAFDTLRVVKLYLETPALTGLYSYLELVIAVLTSMLPSYRFLVSSSDKSREDVRRVLSLVTIRSRYSNYSGYSTDDADNRSKNQPERAANDHVTGQEPTPPLPVFQQI